MITLSKIPVLLEVQHGSTIERWTSTALVPLDGRSSTFNVSGKAVIAESGRKTRSADHSFSTKDEASVEGEICVYASFDVESASAAVLFATKAGARALLVTHAPDNINAGIPAIVVSRLEADYIKELPAATISAFHVSTSYTAIDVMIKVQGTTTKSDQTLQWNTKMYLSTSMVKKTIFGLAFGVLVEAAPFRDGRTHDIDSLVDKKGVSGRICLFDACFPRDAKRVLELATEYGASALFICSRTPPDWSSLRITLPVVYIDSIKLHELKIAGVKSRDLGVEFSYSDKNLNLDVEHEPSSFQKRESARDPRATDSPEKDNSYANVARLGRNAGQPANAQETKRDPPESEGLFATFKKVLGFGYSPKSKQEFNAIVHKGGTSWSYEDPPSESFRNAMRILERIRGLTSPGEREEEVKSLVKAICEMTERKGFVGDVRVMLFCDQIHVILKQDMNSDVTTEIFNAMVVMVNAVTIDPECPKLSHKSKRVLDKRLVHLTRHLSNQSSNTRKHETFVLNALWIRCYHCDALQDGTWSTLNQITSWKYIERNQETILTFMTSAKFNTLVITSISNDLGDIFRIFAGDGEVPILPKALERLEEIYERNHSTRQAQTQKFSVSIELTMLHLVGQLRVVGDRSKLSSKKNIVATVIKGSSFESVRTFEDIISIYDSLNPDDASHQMITTQIKDSICASLERRGDWRGRPAPSDVSSVLQAEVGWLLVNDTGRNSLMTFLGIVARTYHCGEKDKVELLGHIYELFICQQEWTEEQAIFVDEMLQAISHQIHSSSKRSAFAIAAFEVSSGWRKIFTGPEQAPSMCPRLGKLIISQSGLASSIRDDPSVLYDIPSFQLGLTSDALLLDSLAQELIQDLIAECSEIKDAVVFCIKASTVNSSHAPLAALEIMASNIILNSFSKWNPSNIHQLLRVDGSTLVRLHALLCSLPEGESRTKGNLHAHSIERIILSWMSKYKDDDFHAQQLGELSSVLTKEKRNALVKISGEASFPTENNLKGKISAIKDKLGDMSSMLTIHSQNGLTSCSYSILDLATAYHISTEDNSLLSDLIAKYLSNKDLLLSLATLHRDIDKAKVLLHKWSKELQAAAYFLTNKSVLFQHELGTCLNIQAEKFLAKISSILESFRTLFSPGATFSVISKSAKVLAEAGVCVENELRTISFFPNLCIDKNALTWPLLLHSIDVAMILEPLQKFVDCCRTQGFMFVSDDDFHELTSISEMLFSEKGLGLDVGECYEKGLRIANILVPNSASLDLGRRFEICLPTLRFFEALRYCGPVFTMAKERMWFGEEGLQTFYKEWTNVSNVFKSNQSFENELLDRLEPTIRSLSIVGGALGCCSVASLFEILQDNDDINKLEEMRLVQTNICKIQDWFSEGMDDMAAIISKFALIQVSGSFVIHSETSINPEVPQRALVLNYSRPQTTDGEPVTMTEDNIEEFVHHLGVLNHESDNSKDCAAKFTDRYEKLKQIKENQQEILGVGFPDDFSTSTLEYALHKAESTAVVEGWLRESKQKLNQCNSWLKTVRFTSRYSLLFWMDELRYIFQCMCKLRNMTIGCNPIELEPIQKILEALSRLSPDVSQHPECLGLILQYINELPYVGISWLEDASHFVNICGVFSEGLHLSCFQPINRECHKEIAIHKINCCEDMMFAAPLHVLRHIYKSRCPASFEVLDAACTQSPDDINLFLDRVLAFPRQTFTITSVDKLPANEQEIIAHFLAKHSRSADKMHLHCIQSRDSILHAHPGVEIRSWDDASFNGEQHGFVHQRHVNNVTVVCGPSGSGKTRYIRGEMKKLEANGGAEAACVYIHEDFSLTKAVASLRAKFNCRTSPNRAIHFGFSMAAIGNPSRDLMVSVNMFFNSFFILQSIYDPWSGSCFHSGIHSYDIFVEVDCAENENICREWLDRYVPILTCCKNIIQPPLDYILDGQTRRVCTYLRAYDNGTIDRKFNATPCNKRIMFVLDKSESMEIDLGGRTALEVAADCMLTIFDSHLQLMDHVGLLRFNHQLEELIPLQQIEDDNQRNRLRTVMHAARNNPCGSTHMFTALSQAICALERNIDANGGDSWIICLTDGESWDADKALPYLVQQLQTSSGKLHVILVGVNLATMYNQQMEGLCNKYQTGRNPDNKGFFIPTSANMVAIQHAFRQVASHIPVSQTFELDGIMSDVECRAQLEAHRPELIHPQNKLLYSFWVNFLFRRVSVFDQNNEFNYNVEHDSLGSSLMEVMLSESRQMLQREQNCSWTASNHTQLIYDFSQRDSPQFRLICTSPENLDAQKRRRLSELHLPGFSIPTAPELRKRETLDRYLSQALSIPLNENTQGRERLGCIDDHKFVLTLDFTLKLLKIHERVSCGVPCVMEGETGVSKTALTRMYSILVNSQQNSVASASIAATLQSILKELATRYPAVDLTDDNCGIPAKISKFLELSHHHNVEEARQVIHDMINHACSNRSALFASIPPNLEDNMEEEGISELLNWFSQSHLEPTFFDINIHGSLTSDDLKQKFDEVRSVAQKLSCLDDMKVVVFLDEINTSSVLGLLKELIVDRSLNGDLLEENIVIIAACNPARQNNVSQAKPSREIDLGREWASGHYQVKKLPQSLAMILWDYGALSAHQEKEFIHQRIIMMDELIPDFVARGMTEVISCSHELIRTLAKKHIRESLLGKMSCSSETENEAKLRARSVVSLRDIQRVFHLINFFLNDFSLGSELTGESPDKFRRAMLLSVSCVYYLRLDNFSRREFLQKLKSLPSEQYQDCYLIEVLESAMDALIKHTEIPVGIALTSGLKETVFVTLICALSRTPLMIIGPPGCSKTLAVNIVTDNANGEESPALFYRNHARIQPFHYQCSKSSTSNEVASVFDRALQRQSKVVRSKQQCLVFMDEAGLPEEEKESLKVLHYLLEGHMSASPEVSFVCITNHILDAAKSNRCVCLLRPEPDKDELMCIARGLLCQKHHVDESRVELILFGDQMRVPDEFCSIVCDCHLDLIRNKNEFSDWYVEYFGLRDFLHMIMFLRRNATLRKDSVLHISIEDMLHALERNFNGVNSEKFSNICAFFLECFFKDESHTKESLVRFRRHPMDVLQSALSERHPTDASRYNLPRYKMIIDDTNDDSVMRLLQISGSLNCSHSFFKLSGMKEGSEMEKLNLVSRIKFAAQQAERTVVMSQVEEISECFYDLFNQRFKEFNKDGQTTFFANIAIGGISRPCIIHPSFQCIVHVQSNQLDDIPAPFLNRFEKFHLNVDDILSWQLEQLPKGINSILSVALSQCEELLAGMGSGSLWSTSPQDTLKSLFISMIPSDIGSSQSNRQVSVGHSFSSSVLSLIESWLFVDISIEDIQQSIETALTELHGIDRVELRKVVRREGCLDQSQLIKSIHDLESGVKLDSPLSRSLEIIVQLSIVRHVVFRFLQVAMPEAIFLQRDCLPKAILQVYFGSQEHFHLKSFISKLSRGNTGNTPPNCQLYMLHVRSDMCSHSMPKWCGGDGHAGSAHEAAIFKMKVESIVHEDPSCVEIHHLDLLKSEASMRSIIDSWASKQDVCCFVLVVDMQLQSSSNLVNFIRSHIEQMRLAPAKRFLLLLHYPLSCEKPSYPALFLGNWQCAYLDGIGHDGNLSSHLSVNSVFQAACFDQGSLNTDSLLDALLPKAVQYVASQVSFYSRSPRPESVNQDMEFTERLLKIENILKQKIKGKSLDDHLMEKYLSMWTKEAIEGMLHRSAHGLKSGTTHLSLSTAIRSTFQHTFNKFLANCILDINVWSNLDILDEACLNAETSEIFSLVLRFLPVIPLNELLLHKDIHRYLNPLPLEIVNSETLVFFPFYYQISSSIDMAIDEASKTNSFNDQSGDISGFVDRVDQMLSSLLESPNESSLPVDEAMVKIVQSVVKVIKSSSGLFDRYLNHMMLWKFGMRNSSQGSQWILNKIKEMSSSTSLCHQNILCLHIVCRLNVIGIIRMSSWNLLPDSISHNNKTFPSEEVAFEGPQFMGTMLGHFKSSLSESRNFKEWSSTFSMFIQSIPNIIGDGKKIDDSSMVATLRQLVFISAIINVNAPDTSVAQMVNYFNVQTGHSLCEFFELIEDSASDGESWVTDARDKLLRTFFCPSWLKSVSDTNFSDADFLFASIKGEIVEHGIEHQMAVVHLRNLLLSCVKNEQEGTQISLPTKCFSQSIALRVCRNLTCQGIPEFCEESGRRKAMTHYIPAWLRSDTKAISNAVLDDDISWFFQSYRNAFECPLADSIFDVMLGVLVDGVQNSGCSSSDLLIMLEQSISRERAVSHKDYIRRARFALQPHNKEKVSFAGSYLGTMEADALLVCLVCKIAEELSIESQASALCEIGSHSAMRVLHNVMISCGKWPELFFSVILRMRGEAHLASLLSEGGALSSFDWCNQWKQGISSLQNDIMADLTKARGSLQQAEEDAARFPQQYRACPYCRGLFGIDQRNCGRFTCGRDAHGVNGQPAVGGQAVRETLGCGQTFSIDQSLPYIESNQYAEDRAAVQELREDYEQKKRAFDEFNVGAEMWRRAENFDAPFISFYVQREFVESMFPFVDILRSMPDEGSSGTRLLGTILQHLPTLEHLSYLPDMIELYVFVHKTFRHVVTKDMSMNIHIGDVMNEHLLQNRFGSIDGAHMQHVWLRAVEGVNAFLSANNSVVLWNCEEITVPFNDLTSTPLISILSEMEDPTEGFDYLFLIINELVLRYNNFIKSMSAIPNSKYSDEKIEEIHPRTLVRQSKGSVIVNGAVTNTRVALENLAESYWIKDGRKFNTEGLSRAICCDMGMIGLLQPIKSPLSFLREKFAFREHNLNAGAGRDATGVCFCSSDGLFFARNEDLLLYEEAKESAKRQGFDKGTTNKIRHTAIVIFQTFSHGEWTSLLEGLRNVIGHLQQSLHQEEQFGQAIKNSSGIPDSLQRAGFPLLDDAQSNFLNSITEGDLMELICVCGEQLACEAYRFSNLPSQLADPLPGDVQDSMHDGIMSLLETKSSQDVIADLDSFSDDVLDFYCDRLIVPASKLVNEGLHDFLKRNNCCDDSIEDIFAAIPRNITIRNYVDVQKVLLQSKLKLLSRSGERAPSTSPAAHNSSTAKCNYSKWKWVSRLNSQIKSVGENDERYRWKAFGNLWFEDAILKSSTGSEDQETTKQMTKEDEEKEDPIVPNRKEDGYVVVVPSENEQPAMKSSPTEQDADAHTIKDELTTQGLDAPINIQRGSKEEEKKDITLDLCPVAEGSANQARSEIWAFVLGILAVISVIAVIVFVIVTNNSSVVTQTFNNYLMETDSEEGLQEVIGCSENQADVKSNDETCSYDV